MNILSYKTNVILKLSIFSIYSNICFGQIEINRAFPNLSFDQLVDLQSPNDNSNRIFVVEQEGEIYVFENFNSNSETILFLDIKTKLIFEGERGLLGLAFHPDYQNNGYFFVNYTAPDPLRTIVSRFTVSISDSNLANEESETIILEINQPFGNHNGGQISFGPDGYLYIGMGDGGSGGDPLNHGQNLETLLGAMLRIDIDNTSENLNYSIPLDNPYKNNNLGYREEIYAYGLRNPWRFSFDNLSGNCWIADVGQSDYEEINILESGGNYCWNIMEGFHCFNSANGCDTAGLILPLHEYDHSVGESITGGYVYRGSMIPSLVGDYIFADFEYGDVYSLSYNNSDSLDVNIIGDLGPYSVTSFGEDQNKELYVCVLSGEIYRLENNNSSGLDIIDIPDQFTNEDTSLNLIISVLQNDPSLVLFAESDTSSINVYVQDSTLTAEPETDWNGTANITVTGSNYDGSCDTVNFMLTINPVNDPPQEFNFIYPTIEDTISISLETDYATSFHWETSNDVDSDVIYELSVTLDYFNDIYTTNYENITDSSTDISIYEWAILMTNLNLPRWTLDYVVTAADGEYTIQSEAGQFVFQNTSLSITRQLDPLSYKLYQNHPNPFNPITSLRYDLPEDALVNITIYDMKGRIINNLVSSKQSSGFNSVQWNATDNAGQPVSAGVYLYQIEAGNFSNTKKMLFLK